MRDATAETDMEPTGSRCCMLWFRPMVPVLRSVRYFLLMASGGVVSCSSFEPPPPAPYEVVVKVESDPGRALPGADVLLENTRVASTGTDGTATLKLKGNEGETMLFQVKCPEGYQSPSKPISITLRRIASPSKRPEYGASCPPATRTVVVAVRADNGPNLPVMYLGREVGKTDESGAAHVLLTLKPDDTFQLMLKTDVEGGERLRPQNPMATFVLKGQDDVLTFDQAFVVERKKVRPSGPRGPTPLKTH
jgi:hypothetical protein